MPVRRRLALKGLAKDPKERPASSADVPKALEAIDPKASIEPPAPDQAKTSRGLKKTGLEDETGFSFGAGRALP